MREAMNGCPSRSVVCATVSGRSTAPRQRDDNRYVDAMASLGVENVLLVGSVKTVGDLCPSTFKGRMMMATQATSSHAATLS